MLGVLVAMALAAPKHIHQPNLPKAIGEAAPLFAFASPSNFAGYPAYAGLPATDGCYAAASITGTKGEALTFTRATTRFCPTSANEATGVMCASGEVCIASSGSTRGISIFRAGTNLVLRSEEFDNAAWTKNGAVVAAPTVTANYATAPDGTLTADRLQIADCAGTTSGSSVYQAVGTSGTLNNSVWVKANTGTPSVSLCSFAATGICTPIALTTAWRRFDVTYTGTAGSNYINIGCENRTALYSGASNTGAADVSVWGGQVEQSAYATPYVATTSASATRNIEVVQFPTATQPATLETEGSASATIVPGMSSAVAQGGWIIGRTSNSRLLYFSGANYLSWDGTANPTAAHGWVAGTPTTAYNAWKAGASASSLNGTAWTMSADGFDDLSNAAILRLGEQSTIVTGALDGLLSNVCLDSVFTRCR